MSPKSFDEMVENIRIEREREFEAMVAFLRGMINPK